MGFGMAVIAAPILVVVNPNWVPVLITLCAWYLCFMNTRDQWANIELSKLKWAFVARIPGTVLGAYFLTVLSVAGLQLVVIFSVLVGVVVSVIGPRFEYNANRLGVAAFFSGLMGTTTSIGGPPMALVMQHGEAKFARANMSVFFLYSCTISLLSYLWIEALDRQVFIESLSFLPFCILGFYLGRKSQRKMSDQHFRPMVLLICSASACIALYSVIFGGSF